jgi:hypothetical protein
MTDLTVVDLSSLECLVRHLLRAKQQEDAARSGRIALEEKIAALIPGPDRGQKTVKLSDGSSVTVERGFNYRADCAAIETEFDQATKPAPVKTKTTRELDVVGYEWYLANDPEGAAMLNGKVVITPKKIAVSVKEKK